MTEILALLQNIAPLLEPTTLRQLSHVIYGMLVASGRITMLGLSRWTEKGGSYRTIQRLYQSRLPWEAINWLFFRRRFLPETVGELEITGPAPQLIEVIPTTALELTPPVGVLPTQATAPTVPSPPVDEYIIAGDEVVIGRIYPLGEASGRNSASKRPLTQASRRCNKWLKPSSLHRMPTPLKRCAKRQPLAGALHHAAAQR